MNRRDAVARVALIMGGTLIGAEYFLTGCTADTDKSKAAAKVKAADKPAAKLAEVLDAKQISFLNEVGDTILPATKTPGAKAANVGGFMAVMVRDCYAPKDQKIFLEGLTKLDEAAKKNGGKDFLALDAAQRTTLLTALDGEMKQYEKAKTLEQPNHYFRMFKELTLLGFFTSEVGATKALRYAPVPGKYDGNVPYKKGDRAWATT